MKIKQLYNSEFIYMCVWTGMWGVADVRSYEVICRYQSNCVTLTTNDVGFAYIGFAYLIFSLVNKNYTQTIVSRRSQWKIPTTFEQPTCVFG